MSETFTGKQGTEFSVCEDDGMMTGMVLVGFNSSSRYVVPLADLLEFADSIERRETIPDKPEPPLGERTRLLAMMAATMCGRENQSSGVCLSGDAVVAAEAILDAVEKGVK